MLWFPQYSKRRFQAVGLPSAEGKSWSRFEMLWIASLKHRMRTAPKNLSGPRVADCLICLGRVSRMWQPPSPLPADHWAWHPLHSPAQTPASAMSRSLAFLSPQTLCRENEDQRLGVNEEGFNTFWLRTYKYQFGVLTFFFFFLYESDKETNVWT